MVNSILILKSDPTLVPASIKKHNFWTSRYRMSHSLDDSEDLDLIYMELPELEELPPTPAPPAPPREAPAPPIPAPPRKRGKNRNRKKPYANNKNKKDSQAKTS